jgi:hypothetical protein
MSSPGAVHAGPAWFHRLFGADVRREQQALPATTFPELVWAHFLYVRELHDQGVAHGPAENDYHELLRQFQLAHGKLLNAYWCTSEASAVALTEVQRGRYGGFLWRRAPDIQLHTATDWVTRDAPELGHVLHTCETLGIRASEVLSGTAERITMQWILSVAGYTLGVVDQAEGKPTPGQIETAARRANAELAQVETYYDRVGNKTGKLVYFAGMLGGLVWLAVLAAVGAGLYSLTGHLDRHDVATQTFFICYAMGAVGAFVSVMVRMASAREGSFTVDYEVGRKAIRRVGNFRPVIGAIFAVVLYIALRGGLIQLKTPPGHQTQFFYATLAFLAGFSERRARFVLGSAERVLGSGEETSTTTEPAQSPTAVAARGDAATGSAG